MKVKHFALAGLGVGLAALAFRKKRSCRRSGEEHFNEHDAILYGLKAHQESLGGDDSHIREGAGRQVVQTMAPQSAQ